MCNHLLDDVSFAEFRKIGAQLMAPAALKRDPLSDAFFMALQQTRIVRGAPAAEQQLDAVEHEQLPADERRWLLSDESVGGLARLSSQLVSAPLTQALRSSIAAKLCSILDASIRLNETEAERLQDADRERVRP